MLSVIIDAQAPPLALTTTLSPLVRGAVEGLIGSAYLIVREASEDAHTIADASGCRLLAAPGFGEGFARALTYTNGSGVLVLAAGVQVGPEFWQILGDQMPALGGAPAVSRLPSAGLLDRIRRWQGKVSRDQVLLLPPALAREIALAKRDPFTLRYGRQLAGLHAEARRVRFG